MRERIKYKLSSYQSNNAEELNILKAVHDLMAMKTDILNPQERKTKKK